MSLGFRGLGFRGLGFRVLRYLTFRIGPTKLRGGGHKVVLFRFFLWWCEVSLVLYSTKMKDSETLARVRVP